MAYEVGIGYILKTSLINRLNTNGIKNIEINDNFLEQEYVDIKYAISGDNGVTWKSYKNGNWIDVNENTIETLGMTSVEVNSLNSSHYEGFNLLDIMIFMKTYNKSAAPQVNSIRVNTLPKYKNQNIKYAFSNDNKQTWKVYDNGWIPLLSLNDIVEQGMTKEQVEAITSEQWSELLAETLDVAICLMNQEEDSYPLLDQFTINYDQIPNPFLANNITIPVPALGYRNTLINNEYVLKLAEGIAFDDAIVDYDFYTTADRIKLRPLDLGDQLGGVSSNEFAFEVINTFEDSDYQVTLYIKNSDGNNATPVSGGAVLNDHVDIDKCTKVEMSLESGDNFTPVYPVTFDLEAGSSRIVYLKIHPTIYATIGNREFKVKLIARPV